MRLLLPTPLADAAAAARLLTLAPAPASVGELLMALRTGHPAVYHRICDETGAVRQYVNLYVDGDDIRSLAGAATAVGPGAEVLVLQSVAGG